MANFFKKLLKFLLWVLFLLGVAGLFFWISLRYAWPWWFAASCYAGFLSLLIGIWLTRRILARRRQKKLIQQVVAETPAPDLAAPAQDSLDELRHHWASALSDLSRSSLRHSGRPLKLVPWYLMLGESRGGKTTAIQNSLTSSSLTQVEAGVQQKGTRNCDWWFCDQAVILDTAGRYAIPIEENRDREEWEVFLELLLKSRRGRSLQGVIVNVAADRLLDEDFLLLNHKGRLIRQRLNQLMTLLGEQFPVYLLITKMDLVHGFVDFFQHFPPAQVNECMGQPNADPQNSWQQVMQATFVNLHQRLQQLRLILSHNIDLHHYPGALQFPNEWLQLRPPLEQFVKGVFGFDRYLETPFLRGIYFSCGEQNGQASSPFLELIKPDAPVPAAGTTREPVR